MSSGKFHVEQKFTIIFCAFLKHIFGNIPTRCLSNLNKMSTTFISINMFSIDLFFKKECFIWRIDTKQKKEKEVYEHDYERKIKDPWIELKQRERKKIFFDQRQNIEQ